MVGDVTVDNTCNGDSWNIVNNTYNGDIYGDYSGDSYKFVFSW